MGWKQQNLPKKCQKWAEINKNEGVREFKVREFMNCANYLVREFKWS